MLLTHLFTRLVNKNIRLKQSSKYIHRPFSFFTYEFHGLHLG